MRTALMMFVGLLTISAGPVLADLVGHWEFDDVAGIGTATIGDSLEAVGNATYDASGRIGGALLLDGDGDYLRLNDTDALPIGIPVGNEAYTISAFIKPDTMGRNGLVGWGAGATGQFNGSRTGDSGLDDATAGFPTFLNFGWGGPTYDVIADADYTDGEWHHFAATYDPVAMEKKLFFDGVNVATLGGASPLNVAAENFRVGTIHHPYGDENFAGAMDDFRIYNNALGAVEIATLAASGADPQEPATLVAHWSFDDQTHVGAAAVGDNLEAIGDAAYVAGGKIGGALSLDGEGDYLRLDETDALPAGIPVGDEGYSIAAFIKTDLAGRNGIVSWGVGGQGTYNGCRTGDSGADDLTPGVQSLVSANWGGAGYDAIGVGDYADGQWHHVAVTFNAQTREKVLYLDGVQLGEAEITAGLNIAAENFRVGTLHYVYNGEDKNEFFNGMLDELQIYSGALTAAEVAALADAGGDALEGDLNGDGMVGSADLDIVRGNWGAVVTAGDSLSGDASGDGNVGSADLDIVRGNWGATNFAAVPEPGTIVLLMAGLLGLLLRRK